MSGSPAVARRVVRLRQAVLAASELEPAAAALQAELCLDEPFRDPGVAEFGLSNVVFALDDCFLEVIAPLRPGTAAGRFLQRRGDGGYMVIFDLEELEPARARVAAMGIRVVWQVDLPEISGTHLHPADMRGAIVSLDQSRPFGSWRWGGPEWTPAPRAAGSEWTPAPGAAGSERTPPPGAAARLAGITVAVADPAAVANRWATVLGLVADGDLLELSGAHVRFVGLDDGGLEGLAEIEFELPAAVQRGRKSIEIAGTRLTFSGTGRD